ncbi:MAG: type I secretion system permease/ATPase [Parvularculaceae bacterium]
MKAVQQKPELSQQVKSAIADARPLVVRAAWFSMGVNLLMLTGPIYMLQLYDRVLASRSGATLAVLTLLVVGLMVAMGVLDFVRNALISRAAARFDARLSEPAFNAAVDAARYSAGQAGDTPLKDLRTIRTTLGSNAVLAFFDAPFTPIYLLLVFMLHWVLGVVALVGALALVALAVMNERLSRLRLKSAVEAQTAADNVSSAVLRNAYATDAMGMRGALKNIWRGHASKSSLTSAEAGDLINAFTVSTKAGRLLLQSLILGTGALLAINQQVTPGVMIAASIIAARALAPVEQAIGQWRVLGSTVVAWKRLQKFLDSAPRHEDKLELPAPSGHLRLDRVFCQPAMAKKPVVKSITLEARPGEALGIIGPSGAGKSTLARGMIGIERVVAGEVRLDGADLTAWNREEVGRYIGYLPQESELFDGTVAQNIGRFDASATDAEVVAAAKAAGALQLILALPDGFETQIGDRGQRLSVGQRQRIGLARALFRDPVLIVLDEPNANLDAEGDNALSSAVLALKQRGATVVIIAHRPSAIAHVDKLVMLVDGEMRAYGPRDEVLNKIAPGQVASIGGARRPQESEHNANANRSNG